MIKRVMCALGFKIPAALAYQEILLHKIETKVNIKKGVRLKNVKIVGL